MFGYLHPNYAQALVEFGEPFELTHSAGWLLKRPIDDFDAFDLTTCYPLFVCRDWTKLPLDLNELDTNSDLVSVVLVTDPFGGYDADSLRVWFKDLVIPFKEHYVANLELPMNKIVSSNHRYFARRALKKVAIEKVDDPLMYLDDWMSMYSVLIERHHISGIRAFSRASFECQLNTPGVVMFRASVNGKTVGMHWSYLAEATAYFHLVASNAQGYDLGVSYALYWIAIEYFKGKAKRIGMGGTAGLTENSHSGGLDHFKKGWSTETKTAYLCGRILDRDKYDWIIRKKGISLTEYFPAYRAGEY